MMDIIEEIEKALFRQRLSDVTASLTDRRSLERVWQSIQTGYAEADLNLQMVATASGISKNHLNSLLRRKTGFTFHQLVIRRRLLHAMTMMTKNSNILEIALESGFGTLNSFERNLRKVIGITPSGFRTDRHF